MTGWNSAVQRRRPDEREYLSAPTVEQQLEELHRTGSERGCRV